MNIALIGYGKMGKAIEEIIVKEARHCIGLKITQANRHELNIENLRQIDVAIDFTQPDGAYDNVMLCFEAGIPIVVGTTAWAEGLERAKQICIQKNQTLFVSPNFSIGVHLFSQLTKQFTKLMLPFTDYDVQMTEIHHTEKKDAPSGTAVKLANDIIAESNHKWTKWALNDSGEGDTISIHALREENVPGTHIVRFESEIDFIEIKHEAKNRKGFALGAVRAAEFIYGKKGLYTMDNLVGLY